MSKTIITGIKETPKKRACAGLGVRTQMLPWSRGAAGARLRSALWDAVMVPVGQLGHCRGFQWGSSGFQWGSSGVPAISRGCWPAQPQGRARHRRLHIPCSPPPQARQGLASRFGKPRSLVPRLVRVRFHAGAGAVAGRLGPRHEGAAGHEGGAGAPHPHRGHDGAQGASGAFAQAVGRALPAGESQPPPGCLLMISRPGSEGGAGQHWGSSWPWSLWRLWVGTGPLQAQLARDGVCPLCPGQAPEGFVANKPFVRSECGTAQSPDAAVYWKRCLCSRLPKAGRDEHRNCLRPWSRERKREVKTKCQQKGNLNVFKH